MQSSPDSDEQPGKSEADQKSAKNSGISIETRAPAERPAPVSQDVWANLQNTLVSSEPRRSSSSLSKESETFRRPPKSPRSDRYGGLPESPRKAPGSILGVGSKLFSRIKNTRR